MTIQGAIAELQNLRLSDDVPMYYKGGIEKVIETIVMEFSERYTEKYCTNCKHNEIATDYKCGDCQHMDKWEHRYADNPEIDIAENLKRRAYCDGYKRGRLEALAELKRYINSMGDYKE